MGLEVRAGEVGGALGSYTHFHNFRKAVNGLEGGIEQWGSRFPKLMLHSDSDGGYSPEEAGELLRELEEIVDELEQVSYPTVFFFDLQDEVIGQSSIHGPHGELVLCSAPAEVTSDCAEPDEAPVADAEEKPAIGQMIVGMDQQSLYIAQKGDPFQYLIECLLGAGGARQGDTNLEQLIGDVVADLSDGESDSSEYDFLDRISDAVTVGGSDWACLHRFPEFRRGSREFELCGRYPPDGTERIAHGLRPATEAFRQLLQTLVQVAEHSVATGQPIIFC